MITMETMETINETEEEQEEEETEEEEEEETEETETIETAAEKKARLLKEIEQLEEQVVQEEKNKLFNEMIQNVMDILSLKEMPPEAKVVAIHNLTTGTGTGTGTGTDKGTGTGTGRKRAPKGTVPFCQQAWFKTLNTFKQSLARLNPAEGKTVEITLDDLGISLTVSGPISRLYGTRTLFGSDGLVQSIINGLKNGKIPVNGENITVQEI